MSLCVWQAHSASAVLNFSESCTPEILAPYLDGIVGKLLVLLQVHYNPKFNIHQIETHTLKNTLPIFFSI